MGNHVESVAWEKHVPAPGIGFNRLPQPADPGQGELCLVCRKREPTYRVGWKGT